MKNPVNTIVLVMVIFLVIIILVAKLQEKQDKDNAYSNKSILDPQAERIRVRDSVWAEEGKKAIKDTENLKKLRDSILLVWKKTYRFKEDEFRKTMYFHHVNSPYYNDVNFVYPYMGVDSKGEVYIRTLFQYTADDWLFISSVKILYDKLPVEFQFKFERDNSGGKIWEYADVSTNDFSLGDLERITRSDVCKIRYEGRQYYSDRIITQTEKNIIKKVLKDYHSYKQDLPKEIMDVMEK